MSNPASPAAVENATSLLLRSIHSGGEPTLDLVSTRTENTEFLQLDSYVKVLDGTIEAISNALKYHRSNYATRRNFLVPLGRLPVEVLSSIFAFVLSHDGDDFRLRLQHLYQLRAVSKTFQSIINQSPPLWTSIPSNCPLPVVSEALIRSKALPIGIYGLEEVDDVRDQVLPTNPDFLEAVAAHVDRWEGLFLAFPTTTELQNGLTKPAPRLKELSLVVSLSEDDVDVAGAHVGIFGGQVGQLDRLHLFSVPLSWDSTIFRGLKWLSVDNASGQLDPSSEIIIQALSDSPALRTLELSNIHSNSTPTPASWPLVQLNDLEEITLFHVHSSIIDAIFSHITAPSCVAIRVTAEMSPTRAKFFAELEILPKFPALLSAVSLSERPELILGDPQSPMVVWRSSVPQPCGVYAEIALEIGDGGKTDYSSTVKVLFPDGSGHKPAKLRLYRRFLCETRWAYGPIQGVLGSRQQFGEVEIDLPGGRDMRIYDFLNSETGADLEYAIFPSMSSLLIRGSAWSSDPLAISLNTRLAVQKFREDIRLRLVVHGSVNWDEDDLDTLRSCRVVRSVERMEDEGE